MPDAIPESNEEMPVEIASCSAYRSDTISSHNTPQSHYYVDNAQDRHAVCNEQAEVADVIHPDRVKDDPKHVLFAKFSN